MTVRADSSKDTRLGSPGEFCWLDMKTRDVAGTSVFFSSVLGWHFAVDEDDWRRATKISVDDHWIGGVSDLAAPIYPPEIPAHIAYYLAADDIDRRSDMATRHGAQLVVAPSDVGGQGRLATLIDPFGAAFSLWQPGEFVGWRGLPDLPGGPYRMVHACEQPDRARLFYREVLGVAVELADFVPTKGGADPVPQWEVAINSDDLEAVAARVGAYGQGAVAWSEQPDTFRIQSGQGTESASAIIRWPCASNGSSPTR